MNYSNLLIIIIALIIIYLIYNHIYLRESFTLESNIIAEDEAIIKDIQNLNNTFTKSSKLTNDILLTSSFEINTWNNIMKNSKVLKDIDKFDESINAYKNDLNTLEAQLTKINIPIPKYESIKSLQNGMDLNVRNYKNNYNVQFNKKCLRATSTGDYTLKECDYDDPGQLFELNTIYTDVYYNAILEPGLDSSIVNESDNIKYPFIILKSKANGNCLQNNHGAISIEPCQIKKSQRWMGLNHPINCK